MADLLFILVTVAFFGIALALVKACDRIVGPDLELSDTDSGDNAGAVSPGSESEAVGAP